MKERNMLLTMQEAYKEANKHMPNEERIDKVIFKILTTIIYPLWLKHVDIVYLTSIYYAGDSYIGAREYGKS